MSLPRYEKYKDSGISWAGTIPNHWRVLRTKTLFELKRRPPRGEDGVVTAFRDGEVTLRSKRRTEGFTNSLQEIGYQGVRQGDLVIHAMDAFAGAIGVSDSDGKSTPVYSVCEPRQGLSNSRYYARLLRYMALSGFIESLAKGIRERSTEFRWAEAGNVYLPVPPIDEQAVIAAFLDRETAKIDALIAKQEKLIAMLAEKHEATISHVISRGLNPSATTKESGVTWLGELPAHWEVKRMKHLVRESIAGPYGSSLTKAMYTTSGYRVYGQQQVIPDNFAVGDYYISDSQFAEMARYRVKPGDVLVSVMGTIGRAAVVPADVVPGIINPRLVLYRVNEQLILSRYMQSVLNSSRSQKYFSLAAQGTTMEGLNMTSIGELYVALPPLNEQRELLDFIQREGARLDSLSGEVMRALALLKERRLALIAAAVTGQIDVCGAMPHAEVESPEAIAA